MPDNQVVIENVTSDVYNRVCHEAVITEIILNTIAPAANAITSDVSTHGCYIRCVYDRVQQTVTLTVLKKPWLFPMESVIAQIKAVIGEAVAKANKMSVGSVGHFTKTCGE